MWQLFQFNTMLLSLLPFPSLFGLKRKLESVSCLALITLFILCFLIESNQAGVIKNPNTNTTEKPSGNTVVDSKETEVGPTVLTKVHNASVATFSTKLQTVVRASLVTESSKELSNNEILITEARKLMEKAERADETNNETAAKTNNGVDRRDSPDSFHGLQQINQTLENKQEKVQDLSKNSKEFNSNDIKEEKIAKLRENPYENSNQNEQSVLMENKLNIENNNHKFSNDSADRNPEANHDSDNRTSLSLNESGDLNSKATGKFLTELKTVADTPVTKSHSRNSPLDNSIENSKVRVDFVLENKVATITPKENISGSVESITFKALVGDENQFLDTAANILIPVPKATETLTLGTEETESLEVLNKNSMVSMEHSNKANQIKSLDNNLAAQYKEEEGVINETTPKTLISTLKPKESEEQLSSFEGDKKEYARAMFMENTATSKLVEQNGEVFKQHVTTFKPVKLSIKDGIKEFTADQKEEPDQISNNTHKAASNLKEKKPKFINDNSTNAQQLNLPNNAEVWSLAAMKSLPKSNISMVTAHANNETVQEIKAQQNTSTIVNNNSEKSLLDWSQIMMHKELSVTIRNDHSETDKNDENSFDKVTSLFTQKSQLQNQPEEEVITKNSLLEQEPLTTNTMAPVLATTLSFSKNQENNENLNLPDKKVEENMNNHIETLTATFDSTNVDNNPLNTSLDIKPNINKINFASNQTKVNFNNELHTTTETATAGDRTANDDVKLNAHVQAETSKALATTTTTATAKPTTTMSTLTTTSTAVYDDMATVEQISSETTTVSIPETTKQNASVIKVVISEQQQEITNKTYNEHKEKTNSASHHNELDNNILDKNQLNRNENSDLITKTTTITKTTVIPITAFRPKNLAITSTTSNDETFEQEVDQKSNEIQSNLTNTQQQQQSIVKYDLQPFNTTTKTIVYETTVATLTTPSTATEHLTTTTKAISKSANSHTTSSLWESETTTTTSLAEDVIIYETTETNSETSEQTTTQTAPEQENEQKNKGVNKETAIGSSVLKDKKFENKEYQNTTTAGTNLLVNTSTETPVVVITEKEQDIFESSTPRTEIETTLPGIIGNTTEHVKNVPQQKEDVRKATTATANKIMNNTQETPTISSSITSTTIKEEETYISLLDDTTTTTIAAPIEPHSNTISTASSSHLKTTTTLSTPLSSSSTLPSAITTKIEEIYNVINSTTTEVIQTTTQQLLTEIVEESTYSSSEPDSSSTTTFSHLTEMLPPKTTPTSQIMPTNVIDRSSHLPTLTSIMGGSSGNMFTKNSQSSGETDVNVIIAITVSVIGVVALILLVGFLYLMRKRQKQTSYSQRCRPVSLDEYTIDNTSVGGSMRKSNALRASKRTYGNLAFDDPTLRHNPMGVQELAKFAQEKLRIFEEFRDVPQITSRLDEAPTGCEEKNRYANVLPLPETRVILQRRKDDEKSEYINANYVTGPKDPPNYYIACQAPLESTVEDFWRMVWEQQSRVIIQATDLIEFGVEKCAEYLPPSVTLDNHSSFGDFQITLQNREVKDKYAISTLLLKHVIENSTRELTHYWYKWPEVGVPAEEAPIIAMLLEARSSLISYAIEQANEDKEKSSVSTLKTAEEGIVATLPTINSNVSSDNGSNDEINGNISMVHIKKSARNQGPLTIHCSPGTGRTGTIIACDIALRSLETPKRIVDIPQIVYGVRRGRASAVLTKEQYEFIYKVANMYAAKITNPTNYNYN